MECLQCKTNGQPGVEMERDGEYWLCPFGHQEMAVKESLPGGYPDGLEMAGKRGAQAGEKLRKAFSDEQDLKIMMDVSMMMAAWSLFKTMTSEELEDFWEIAHKRLVLDQGLSSEKVEEFINAMKKSQQDMKIYFQEMSAKNNLSRILLHKK